MAKSEQHTRLSPEGKEALIGVRAVALDIFGTATRRHMDIMKETVRIFKFTGTQGWQFAHDWMDLYGEYMQLASLQNPPWDYDTFMEKALAKVLEEKNLLLSDSGRQAFNRKIWHESTFWPDVREGIWIMQQAGLAVGPFSNGGRATVNDIAEYNQVRWDFVVSPQDAGSFKSEAEFWENAPGLIAYKPQETLFVSTTPSEIRMAGRFHLRCAMVPRKEYPGRKVEIPADAPVFSDFRELAQALH